VEHAFTNNLTAKIEYLYTDLGSFSYGSTFVPGSAFPTYSESVRQDLKFHTVRAGINYKF
jgi:outer membrane immunogenic protein